MWYNGIEAAAVYLFALVLVYVRADAVDAANAAIARGGTGHHTHYLSPVRLNDACKDPAYYCIYLNENYRAVVNISPFYASDNRRYCRPHPFCSLSFPTSLASMC